MRATNNGKFRIREVTVTERGCTYTTFRVTGWLDGRRIRKQFASRAEAQGEKMALQVEAANAGGEIQSRNTRLSVEQLSEAEAAFARLASKSMSTAVDWFLKTYRPPVTEMALKPATAAFLADRKAHVGARQLRDYTDTLKHLATAFPSRLVHEFTTADMQAFLSLRPIGKKRFNNLRGDLCAFFSFCASAPRQWRSDNPVDGITPFKISRGIPEIIHAETAAALMAYLETFRGGPRSKRRPGFLVPYFALCLFAGLRPSVRDGEIRKLADSPDLLRLVDVDVGVIRITPEISKINELRQVRIQPNLAAWLAHYPLKDWPIIVPNMDELVAGVRKKFGLTEDVARHTFISMHVGKFKSIGAAALEAGNSEAMTKRHYLNMVTDDGAELFWSIEPEAFDGPGRASADTDDCSQIIEFPPQCREPGGRSFSAE